MKKAIENGTTNKNDTKMTELPSGPEDHVAIDFKGALTSGSYLLVVKLLMNTQGLLKLKLQNQPQ